VISCGDVGSDASTDFILLMALSAAAADELQPQNAAESSHDDH
jgi:hypothetical protein